MFTWCAEIHEGRGARTSSCEGGAEDYAGWWVEALLDSYRHVGSTQKKDEAKSKDVKCQNKA